MNKFNGWKNRETWNVSLWIQNDGDLYETARRFKKYNDLVIYLAHYGDTHTPDGVSYRNRKVSRREINELLRDIK